MGARRAAILACVALSGSGWGMAAAASGAAIRWSAPVLVDHRAPFGSRFAFAAVSCPSTTLCVAVETADRVLISTDPGAAEASWRTMRVPGGATANGPAALTAVSCPAVSLCMAVDSAGDVLRSTDPGAAAPRWRLRRVDRLEALTGIACPSRSLCVATDIAGNVLTSHDPASDSSSWYVQRVDESERTLSAISLPSLVAVSCPSAGLCVALDRAGNVVSSTDPGAASPRWHFTRLALAQGGEPPAGLAAGAGISCPSRTLCVIASGLDLLTSTAPTAGPQAWVLAERETFPAFFNGVTCHSPSSCVAVDTAGNVFTSTAPAAGGSAWTVTSVDPAATQYSGLTAVSCPSARLCVATDGAGNVLSATAPTEPGSPWQVRNLDQGYDAIEGLSCPTARLCVGYDNAGNILVSTHPAPRRSAWRVFPLRAPITSLTCVPGPFCFGLAGDGILTSGDPAGGPQAWQITPVNPNTASAISCPSASLCVVAEGFGDLATSTDPTAGPGAWHVVYGDTAVGLECGKYGPGEDCDPDLDSVSCPSVSFCAASDGLAGAVVTSTTPAESLPWTVARVDDPPSFGTITCPSPSLCVKYDDYSNRLIVSRRPNDPSSWQTMKINAPILGITCVSATRCLAYDSAGHVVTLTDHLRAWRISRIDSDFSLTATCSVAGLCAAFDPQGNVLTAGDPTAGRRAWSRAHVDAEPLSAVSCPSPTLCVAADGLGNVVVGTAGGAAGEPEISRPVDHVVDRHRPRG